MLSPALQESLNRRLTNEFVASLLYLAFAAYFEAHNLRGFSHWMRVQSQEEQMHGMRLFDLLLSRGGQVRLQTIPAPPADFASPLDVAQQALAREETVSADFQSLYRQAVTEQDFTTETQLQWFLTEQVEEEQLLGHLVEQLKLAGGQGQALLLLDRELAARRASLATVAAMADTTARAGSVQGGTA